MVQTGTKHRSLSTVLHTPPHQVPSPTSPTAQCQTPALGACPPPAP